MPMTCSRHTWPAAALTAALLAGPAGIPVQTAAQDDRASWVEALTRLPRSEHNSAIRVDPMGPSGVRRIWIDANEDDLRLYSPAGAQLDADLQLASVHRQGSSLSTVTMLVETRGGFVPGTGVQAFSLSVDGRDVPVTHRVFPESRSGDLRFLSTEVVLPLRSLVVLATAQRVDGRAWGVAIRLRDAQLELLRAYLWRLIEVEAGR